MDTSWNDAFLCPGSKIIRIFISFSRERMFPSLVCDIFSMLMGAVQTHLLFYTRGSILW